MLDINFFNHPLAGTPFGTAFDLCLILAAMAWLLSVVAREYSWVDRLWSICPIIYCLIVAASVDFDVPRLNLMLILVSLWGVRLEGVRKEVFGKEVKTIDGTSYAKKLTNSGFK